ncbi:16S rRNA (cytosine(1407)-C(5))-methyltransferase RsmF [Shewanella yunxiaonensis]|uniref:Ribosomal RNA small subunit methyltransferase F n=1 Tax=Shewanella yunxiaonensis TaxID=2829809 RepID=A0ABX7YQX0_9GAMM|nr:MULTISPECIES: 16S rRNA (cytosine(1407)-C(5))-methyltransferase RsmF [Shewanella]MDF0535279.1 16S rRNA (cytosine(1407)-C(5))-methyltransferase RsmF [Shewanella sp. A32]QUN04556.1 16S rRNA (cytosine(1407)-C(5))-methyltransferase RsmF [Shewanella yunxiaonensis]
MVQLNQNFINNIAQELPSQLSLEEFIAFCDKPLRPSLRVNTLKIDSASLLERMQAKGWQFEQIPWCPDGFWYQAPDSVQAGNTVEYLQGLFYVQEASSMLPPMALLYDTHLSTVLDMASAPGSKTTQIAAMMHNEGTLVANEYSASRIKALHFNIQRMGVSNAVMTHFDARVFGESLYETFDAILLDAPCSGEGTVRKDPQALKNWDASEIDIIAATQRDLIESAFLALKPGGVLVYSTCTLNKTENHGVCHHLKQQFGDAVIFESLIDLFRGADQTVTDEGFLHVWPQVYDSEGFFVARIRKATSVPRQLPAPQTRANFPFQPVSTKQYQLLMATINPIIGVELPKTRIWVRDDEFWLFPEGFAELIGKLRYQRIGVRLATAEKHGIKLQHEAVMALTVVPKLALSVDETQAEQYMMGRDIMLSVPEKAQGERVLVWQQQVLGMVKHLGNRLKNQLPRNLVRDNISNNEA